MISIRKIENLRLREGRVLVSVKKYAYLLESIFPEEAVIINIKKRTVYLFNSSATKIWTILDNKPRGLDYITNKFCKDIKVSKIKARRSILKFFRQLSKRELIDEKRITLN